MLNRTTIITYVVLITFSFLIFRLVTNNVTSQYQIFVQFTKDLKKNVPVSISNDNVPLGQVSKADNNKIPATLPEILQIEDEESMESTTVTVNEVDSDTPNIVVITTTVEPEHVDFFEVDETPLEKALTEPKNSEPTEKLSDTFDTIFNPNKTYPLNPNRLKVLIVAQYRGGSTLSSDAFNINPDSAFLFEPLAATPHTATLKRDVFGQDVEDQKLSKEDMDHFFGIVNDYQRDILNGIFNCQLPNLNEFFTTEHLNQIGEIGGPNKKRQYTRWVNYGMTFPEYPRNLFQAPFCDNLTYNKNGNMGQIGKCWGLKKKIKQHWSNMCRSKRMISAKVIRLEDINVLKNTDFYDDPYFKMIMVIRDPRGVLNSRLSVSHEKNKVKRTQMIQNWTNVLKKRYASYIDLINTSPKKNKNILMVRYEDFALDTNSHLNRIFKFLNLDTKNNPEIKENYQLVKKTLFDETHSDEWHRTNSYGTAKRNAKKTVVKWKNYLPWDEVVKVQEGFGDKKFWERFGYHYIGSQADFKKITADELIGEDWSLKL